MNARRVTTSKGIIIGGAWFATPPAQSADADAIQVALLARRRISRVARAVGAALIAVAMRRSKRS